MTSEVGDDIDPRIFHNKSFRLYKTNRAISLDFSNQQLQYIRLNITKYVYNGVTSISNSGISNASDFLRGVIVKHVVKKLDVTPEKEGDIDDPNILGVSYLTVKQSEVGLRLLLVFITGETTDSRSVILMKNGMRQGYIASKDFDGFMLTLLQSMPSEQTPTETENIPLAIRALTLSSEYLMEVANNVLLMFQRKFELSQLQSLELVFGQGNVRLRINDHLQNIAVSVPSDDLIVLLEEPSESSPIDTILEFVSKTTTLNLSRLEVVRLITGPLSLFGDGGVRISTTHSQLLPYIISTLYSEL